VAVVRTPLADPAYYHAGARKHAAGGAVPTGQATMAGEAQSAAPDAAVSDLSGVAWRDLRALAKQSGVTDYAKMKRPALEAAIRSAQGASSGSV
jgi:hypothetical protein